MGRLSAALWPKHLMHVGILGLCGCQYAEHHSAYALLRRTPKDVHAELQRILCGPITLYRSRSLLEPAAAPVSAPWGLDLTQ